MSFFFLNYGFGLGCNYEYSHNCCADDSLIILFRQLAHWLVAKND